MNDPTVIMPDGTPFAFWDDRTRYERAYHVACEHPQATDDGPGTEERPFATIGRAAALLQPGEKVIVHAGVYRECVRPARGGTGPDAMIAYEAAPGEEATIRGSQPWAGPFTPSEGWNLGPLPEGVTVWTGEMPAEWFLGYNPFIARNVSSEYNTFVKDWTREETEIFLLRRGMLLADGVPLKQVSFPRELAASDGAFWVEEPGLRLHFRLPGDADPQSMSLEVTTREQALAPLDPGLGYIRISGLRFETCADGFPVPQRAMVSAARGDHWIIEDCTLRWANACAIDLGNETWHRRRMMPSPAAGHHIVRRNHICDIGTCGIAAVGNNASTLVEDNTIERIGYHNIERLWECGGLKFHTCDSGLFRRNIFRHIHHAPGLWLDVLNHNCRITENVFADIDSIKGALYLEMCFGLNVLDHNVFWDIRGDYSRPWGVISMKPGFAVNIDSGEQCVFAHNLLADVPDSYALWFNLDQQDRIMRGRTGLCRRHKILNNVFVGCPERILLSRTADNQCDGNLYHGADDFTSFCIEYPAPQAILDLEAWQTYYGYDQGATQAAITVSFDP
ncbi:MAG: right-handed parallel beta-helix repeat-containing protein, partial [Anaerolineae bacterium]|nr:right-handed parallel beta-helix repeat-containing protein [Anaerolineae bacterium]